MGAPGFADASKMDDLVPPRSATSPGISEKSADEFCIADHGPHHCHTSCQKMGFMQMSL
jgi:hypothetical protein